MEARLRGVRALPGRQRLLRSSARRLVERGQEELRFRHDVRRGPFIRL